MSGTNDSIPAEIDEHDDAWELEGAEGEQLNPDDPEVLAARRAAGDETAPAEVGA